MEHTKIDVIEVPHELKKVVEELKRQYEAAKQQSWIRNRVAYAIYYTWRKFDTTDGC